MLARCRRHFMTKDHWLYLITNPEVPGNWNLPNAWIQGNGAALLRAAVIGLSPWVDLLCTLHDGLYVACAEEDVQEVTAEVTAAMNAGAEVYFGAAPFIEITEHRDRFTDKRGDFFWEAMKLRAPTASKTDFYNNNGGHHGRQL